MQNRSLIRKMEIEEPQVPNYYKRFADDTFLILPDIPVPFIFIKSNLRLVIDLQTCIKAQQSEAYAQKVKLSNLKQMAQTVAYIQEHGYDSPLKISTLHLTRHPIRPVLPENL